MLSHALFQPGGLGVLLVSLSVSLGVVLVGQVHDDLPLAVGVDGTLGAAVEDVGRADVAALLVIILGISVSPEEKKRGPKREVT